MTKKRILDVATEEFATLGYSGLSMNKLAEKLKINKAMIYYYFKDKRNLYDEVISSIIELNEEEKKEILNSSLEAKEKFKRYIKLYTKTISNNPNIIPLTLREMANFDLGIENNIPNSIEQELVLMKQIILQLNLKIPIPIIFGVLTLDTEFQAWERLGGVHGHKGEEAMIAALKMVKMKNDLDL